MGAADERMQLRCAVRPSPLALQRGSSNCERALAARLGATWHSGTNRERVERTLLSTTAAATSLEPRTAVQGPAHTESGFDRQKLSHLRGTRGDVEAGNTPLPSRIFYLEKSTVKIWLGSHIFTVFFQGPKGPKGPMGA